MLVRPYNWNIEYPKKKFILKIALMELIMKRYPPTPISLHTHKTHKALTFSFHSLRFAARALKVAHDSHPTVCLSSSIIVLHAVSGQPDLMKRNKRELCETGRCQSFETSTAVYPNNLSHEGHLLSKLFTISHQSADDQDIFPLTDLTKIPQRMFC